MELTHIEKIQKTKDSKEQLICESLFSTMRHWFSQLNLNFINLDWWIIWDMDQMIQLKLTIHS